MSAKIAPKHYRTIRWAILYELDWKRIRMWRWQNTKETDRLLAFNTSSSYRKEFTSNFSAVGRQEFNAQSWKATLKKSTPKESNDMRVVQNDTIKQKPIHP